MFEIFLTYIKTHRKKLTEAVTRGVLCEKVFLEISQNPREKTCASYSIYVSAVSHGFWSYFNEIY